MFYGDVIMTIDHLSSPGSFSECRLMPGECQSSN